MSGNLRYPVDTDGTSVSVDASQILDALKMTFMGSFDAHNGRWGVFTDVIYLDLGGEKSNTRDFSIGNGLPADATANVSLDLKATVWTTAGLYRIVSNPAWTVDALAGARMLNVNPTLGWTITGNVDGIPQSERTGTRQSDETVWDGIIGARGRFAFGDRQQWIMPFYGDIGTGGSDLTYQLAGGIAYAFKWGEVVALWRYLDYKFKSDKNVENLTTNGPLFGVRFVW
jgi:hypothetical protein